MKVIVTGSRCFFDARHVYYAIDYSRFKISELVTGDGIGPEALGKHWAAQQNPVVPCREFRTIDAEEVYRKQHKLVGQLSPAEQRTVMQSRNQAMVNYADALIAVWDDVSVWTLDILRRAGVKGVPICCWNPTKPDPPRWWV